jgi:hypothetical protein
MRLVKKVTRRGYRSFQIMTSRRGGRNIAHRPIPDHGQGRDAVPGHHRVGWCGTRHNPHLGDGPAMLQGIVEVAPTSSKLTAKMMEWKRASAKSA